MLEQKAKSKGFGTKGTLKLGVAASGISFSVLKSFGWRKCSENTCDEKSDMINYHGETTKRIGLDFFGLHVTVRVLSADIDFAVEI